MFSHLTLTVLPVRDQARSVEFFVDKLGFDKRADEPYGDNRWIEVAPRGSQSAIILSQTDAEAAFAQHMAPILFGCDDVAAEATRLRGYGLEVSDPATEHWGTFILVTDPEGRNICVTQNDTVQQEG